MSIPATEVQRPTVVEGGSTSLTPADFTYERGIARALWTKPQRIELVFDQLHVERRTAEVGAEVTVSAGERTLHRGRINLTSTRSRAEVAKYLATRRAGPDWNGLLEEACWKAIDALRQGRPAILLRDAVQPTGGRFILPPFLLAEDPVVLFGDGGNAKSYLGLALALSVHSGKPLVGDLRPSTTMRTALLDFEWSPWPHRQRARALWPDSELPDVLYVPCGAEGPLTHQVDRLRALLHQHRIQYVVIDSVALACDGPPEDAQVALAFFQALARLDVGSVSLAHVNRGGDTDKPFGSAFWHNSARATWFVKRAAESDPGRLDLTLTQRKLNDGPPMARMGLRFTFDAGRTKVTRLEPDETKRAATDPEVLAVAERILAMTDRPRTLPEIRAKAGSTKLIASALSLLISNNQVIKTGSGTKNHPYIYQRHEMPVLEQARTGTILSPEDSCSRGGVFRPPQNEKRESGENGNENGNGEGLESDDELASLVEHGTPPEDPDL